MSEVTTYDFQEAIILWDTKQLRTLLRRAKRQHIPLSDDTWPSLPRIVRLLYRHWSWLYKYNSVTEKTFTKNCWKPLPDVAYEILKMFRPYYKFDNEFSDKKKLYWNHFLYQPILRGDVRMLEYLWAIEPLKSSVGQQSLNVLFRAAIEDFCYMRLPDWEGLPLDKSFPSYAGKPVHTLDLNSENWLTVLFEQAERCHIDPPKHFEFLLEHGCRPEPSDSLSFRINVPRLKLELDHSDLGSKRRWEIHDLNIDHQNQDCGELVRSCLRNGEYWPLSCVCDFPDCAGVFSPVLSMRFGDVVRWRVTSSEHLDMPRVYYLAVPVKEYLSDMDMLLEIVERGMKEDGVAMRQKERNSVGTYFKATPPCLKNLSSLRRLIRRKLARP